MGPDGGSPGTLMRCAREGVETRLRCAQCGDAVCPKCYVRTAVGLRCGRCGAASGPRVAMPGRGRRAPVLAVGAVVVALVVAGGAWAVARGGASGSSDEVDEGGGKVTVPATVLGRGEIPGGFVWILEARRDGGVCTTLTVSPGPPARERCSRIRSDGPIDNTTTSLIRTPDSTTYVTLGQVSDRVERVRVAPQGAPPWEVPALGGGMGLDMRFFVTHTTANVATTFTALGADGTELARMDRPPVPEPR